MLCTFITFNNYKPYCIGNLTVMMQILLKITVEASSCGLWPQEQNPQTDKSGGRKSSVNTVPVNSIMNAMHGFCQEQAVNWVK